MVKWTKSFFTSNISLFPFVHSFFFTWLVYPVVDPTAIAFGRRQRSSSKSDCCILRCLSMWSHDRRFLYPSCGRRSHECFRWVYYLFLSLLVSGIIRWRCICHCFLRTIFPMTAKSFIDAWKCFFLYLVFSHFIHFLMFIPIMALLLSLSVSWWWSSSGCCDWHSQQLHHHQQQPITSGSGSGSHPLGRSRSIVANPARQSSGRRSQSFLSSLIHFSEKVVTCGALAYYLYSMVTLFRVTWCQ